jgi:2-polyprenyl-3-methyl-5-hydroxy-6-metoxy-1,4-benzoquinol methylase
VGTRAKARDYICSRTLVKILDMQASIPCDLCGAANPRFVLNSRSLDGPLVECVNCGFRYVGTRRSALTFGSEAREETAAKVRAANQNLRYLRLEEEHRLALLNSRWRLDLIRQMKPSGKLLEIGCARGDFLQVARESFDVYGVEPNPELAESSSKIAPVHQDVIERTPWNGFDIVASFHVIEHVDSPRSFIAAAAEKLKPGGLLVIETPNIDSLPFKILKSRWRQFIPEHYYFFTPKTISRLLSDQGLRVQSHTTIGKYASADLIVNRLSRYMPWLPNANGLSKRTFRINPRDIMLVFATKGS